MRLSIILLLMGLLTGCRPASDGQSQNAGSAVEQTQAPANAASETAASLLANDSSLGPQRITNRFGMTFCLVTVDTSRPDHTDDFPQRAYYLQETELSGRHNDAFQKAALKGGIYTMDSRRSLPTPLVQPYASIPRGAMPSEWSHTVWYANALSLLDEEFEYRLPTRAEWTFACMSGYEQRCDANQPNAFGCQGMHTDGRDAEAIDERWDEGGRSAVVMGYWKSHWGVHVGETRPDCPCERWTVCNPDADDSLNELITARYVLLPKNGDAASERPR